MDRQRWQKECFLFYFNFSCPGNWMQKPLNSFRGLITAFCIPYDICVRIVSLKFIFAQHCSFATRIKCVHLWAGKKWVNISWFQWNCSRITAHFWACLLKSKSSYIQWPYSQEGEYRIEVKVCDYITLFFTQLLFIAKHLADSCPIQ